MEFFFFTTLLAGAQVASAFQGSQIFRLKASRAHSSVRQEDPQVSSPQTSFEQQSYPHIEPIWWDLFKNQGSLTNAQQEKNDGAARSSSAASKFIPNLSAWKSIEEPHLTPPPSLVDFVEGRKALSDEHYNKVEELWSMIRTKGSLRHLNAIDNDRVIDAIKIAYVALWGKQTIRSLEVSINRAVGVAAVLGELKADVDVVLAGILHEVVEISSGDHFLMKEIGLRFGDDVLELCKKYSTLPKYMARKTDYTPFQSENQLQMLVLLAEDYRVLYIRLADRLHTMRVLRKLPLDEPEQHKIAQEALNVYTPLAHKMGIMKVRNELEDLAFRVLEPDMFIRTRYTQTAANKAYHEVADRIQEMIANDPVLQSQQASLRLTYRIKGKYQLYLKMKRKNFLSPNEVRDALGLRIIIDAPLQQGESNEQHDTRLRGLCYYVVERLRHMPGWEPSMNGFKDYILGQKENGYQSLHQYIKNTALGTNVEVQVRTKQMHVNAELGGAAHWFYKDQIYRPEIANSKSYKLAWRSHEQMSAKSSAEMIGLAKKQLRSSRVFVYLDDQSTVINLRKGATALDAAFAIHTNLALTTERISISGKDVPLNQVLNTGDIVTVHRAKDSTVQAQPSWFGYLRTTSAQATLRRYMRDNERETLVTIGIVQLLLTLSLNEKSLGLSSPLQSGAGLNAYRLVKNMKERCGMSAVDFFTVLGSVSCKEDARKLLASLLNVPAEKLQTTSSHWALTWARMQGRESCNGWEDADMQSQVLLPLLRDILPNAELVDVEQRWCELIGPNSLSVSDSSDKSFMVGVKTEAYSNDSAQYGSTSIHSKTRVEMESSRISTPPKIFIRSKYSTARKPFALNASSLSQPLLRLAKQTYAKKALERQL